MITRFVRGLRFDIKEKFNFSLFLTLYDVITYAESIKDLIEISPKKPIGEPHRMAFIAGSPQPLTITLLILKLLKIKKRKGPLIQMGRK